MAHYILVHGAWEGSWTWEDTIPTLEKKGHTVTTVDLPGSIGNKQAIPLVTLASYVQTVIDVVERFDHKVILAGHSLGGAVISGVAERLPEKVERLIYVTVNIFPRLTFRKIRVTSPCRSRRCGISLFMMLRIPKFSAFCRSWQSDKPPSRSWRHLM
jgi:pimeloyl-ACP methyl ester carboxylesterase